MFNLCLCIRVGFKEGGGIGHLSFVYIFNRYRIVYRKCLVWCDLLVSSSR